MPKVIFSNIPLSIELDWIHGFLFRNEWGWGKYIIRKHPKIKEVFSLKNEKEQIKFLEKYIIQFKKDNTKIIEENKEKYEKAWQKIDKIANLLDISISVNIGLNTKNLKGRWLKWKN